MTDFKDRTVGISLSTVATLIPVLGIVWFIIQPLLIESISEALAEDFDQQIESHAEPIQSAFKVLLLSDINRLKRSIARLEFKQAHEPDEFTEADAARLADYEIELEAFQEAYEDLR